jgi:hypothetical protein
MKARINAWRRCVVLATVATSVGLTSCDGIDRLLEAKNPAALDEDAIDDAGLITVLVNSVTGALTGVYQGTFVSTGTLFTDETVYGINDESSARLNLRVVRYDQNTGTFGSLSHLRFMADSVAGRLRTLLPKLNPAVDPGKDRRMALVLAHAGYGYLFLAEQMCEATVNVSAKIYTPKELAQIGIERFEEAIRIATAAGTGATDVLNLARTGLARAALLTGDNAKVMAAAREVPANFVWWVEYKNQVVSNSMQGRVTGANFNLGVHPRFLNGTYPQQDIIATQTDPRIQHTTRWALGHNQLTKMYKPYLSIPYSGWSENQTVAAVGRNCEVTPRPAGCPSLYTQDTDIKLASGLEAMHHYYEAAGPNGTGPAGTTLQFVNARRAVGRQAPVTLSGTALMAELRNQRAIDTYLGGFRMGDLRRWAAQGIDDPRHSFPTGTHPNPEWGPYGDATCWPLPIQEYIGNPGIKK